MAMLMMNVPQTIGSARAALQKAIADYIVAATKVSPQAPKLPQPFALTSEQETDGSLFVRGDVRCIAWLLEKLEDEGITRRLVYAETEEEFVALAGFATLHTVLWQELNLVEWMLSKLPPVVPPQTPPGKPDAGPGYNSSGPIRD